MNDTTAFGGVERVAAARSVENLLGIAEFAAAAAVPLLVIGPPPVTDAEQNDRIAGLDRGYRDAAAEIGIPYVSVFRALLAEPVWMREVRLGDGSHPGAGGYGLLADVVWPTWRGWIDNAP